MKNYSILLAALIAASALSSCKKDDDSNPGYTLEGHLANTTGRPVRQASVTLTPIGQAAPAATGITDAQGRYALGKLAKGRYLLRAERPGYTAEVDTVDLTAARHDMKVRGAAQVQGLVINSQTGRGLDSAQVALTFRAAGTQADTALTAADFVVRTDAQGRFTMAGVATGEFTYIVRSRNFNTDVVGTVALAPGANTLDQHTLVQQVPVGALRIVLTWGENPRDLDSHLSGPADAAGTSRFHCYYMQKAPDAGVNLDVDDVTSFGPETTTLLTQRNGTCRFSVHNYSITGPQGAQSIAASGASVRVFSHQGLVAEFTPPAAAIDAGNTWRVFEVNSVAGAPVIVPVNTYATANGAGDTSVFRTDRSKPAMKPDQF